MERKDLYSLVDEEVASARSKFHSPALLLTAFSEEAGELVKAVLNSYHGQGGIGEIHRELVHAMAMLVRLYEEGDPAHRLDPFK